MITVQSAVKEAVVLNNNQREDEMTYGSVRCERSGHAERAFRALEKKTVQSAVKEAVMLNRVPVSH